MTSTEATTARSEAVAKAPADSILPWPEFGPVFSALNRALDRLPAPLTVPTEADVLAILKKLLAGQDATVVASIFGSAGLPMQRAIQILRIEAGPVATARAKLAPEVAERIAKAKARAAGDEAALRDVFMQERTARLDAAAELLEGWLAQCAGQIVAIFSEHARRQAEKARAVADAAAIYAKLRKAAVPLTTELRGTLEKLCSEMAKCGQIYEAGEMRAIYVATLDSLERVLTNLNPPVPAKK